MSALGPTGITAYFGLLEVGRPKAGETVVISGAAGATGSAVGQIAKIQGCRAIGIAGGAEKCRWLVEEYGFDAAVDYKTDKVGKKLRELCPNGIDVFFDNVGGEILDAALARLAMRGRVVLCGAIAGYNDAVQAPGPKNYLNLLSRRGRMEGFIVLDYFPRAAEATAAISRWMQEGLFKDRVDVQVALRGKRPADLEALVHRRPMEGPAVRFRVDAHAMNPHGSGGAGHPDRDLAAVRDQHAAEHAPPTFRAGCCRASSAVASRVSYATR